MIAVSERVFLSMFKDEPEVLTVPEAAKLLRIGVNNTYRLASDGRLGCIRVTNKVLIPKMSVIAFLVEITRASLCCLIHGLLRQSVVLCVLPTVEKQRI